MFIVLLIMLSFIECEIDSNTLLDEVVEYKFYPFVVKMYPSQQKRLHHISIECPFTDYKKYLVKLVTREDTPNEIIMPSPDFFKEQIELMQYLESFAALDLGVRKIRWETPTIKWLPETPEERQLLMVDSYSYKETFPTENRKLTKEWLQNVILHRNMVKHLVEPLSFYRLGTNFYFEKMYILSFLNYFLMTEGAFAPGNTDKKHTIAAFMAASILRHAIENALEIINKPYYQKHLDWFNGFVFNNPTINGDPIRKMINIFYDQRGLLSHYSIASYKKRHDFQQEIYSSLAFLAMSVCHFISIKLRLQPFTAK